VKKYIISVGIVKQFFQTVTFSRNLIYSGGILDNVYIPFSKFGSLNRRI